MSRKQLQLVRMRRTPSSAAATVCRRTASRSPSKWNSSATRVAAAPLPADPDGADRLARRAARWTGDAGYRHRNARAITRERSGNHFDDRFLTDRAGALERLRLHAEQRLLRLVAVRDDAALEPCRAAGDVGQRLRDPAAGARFGGRPSSGRARAGISATPSAWSRSSASVGTSSGFVSVVVIVRAVLHSVARPGGIAR